ncbi:MAG: TIGR02444 family protein [Mycobacterium sp.]|jgi:uncharacterized protein (TIGR02444 family)
MIESRGEFQRFAVDVYGSDGVSTACVLLQDRCGVDVNVLLLAAYVGAAERSTFTDDEMAAAVARTGHWQRDVVGPLRAVRTRLRDGPPPAPSAATVALRERIKAIELDAEMIELDELADVAHHLEAKAALGDAAERASAAMHVVLRHSAFREPTDEECNAIAVIASAAARSGSGEGMGT